jgi:hypothetical protein
VSPGVADNGEPPVPDVVALPEATPTSDTTPPMKSPVGSDQDYTDGRKPWHWESHYPVEARKYMSTEAIALVGMLVAALLADGVCLGLAGQPVSIGVGGPQIWISFRLLAIFCSGWVGGVTFSMKWLIHSVAKGKWHMDRRYWRFMVPVIGGVYACVVMTLFGAGLFATQPTEQSGTISSTAALAFLVGYFSDGVSGLLSNVANAVFGTLEKK